MAIILFLLTLLLCFFLIIQILVKRLRHRNVTSTLSILGVVVFTYVLLWIIFYLKSSYLIMPLGTDVCFDDWCATITQIDKTNKLASIKEGRQFIILHIRMSNRARGIAQKPSEPRIHIIDNTGQVWAYSESGQKTLENVTGKQISLDQKLELHQSLETELVFDVPQNATGLMVLIEEGPFITELLLPDNRKVFRVP